MRIRPAARIVRIAWRVLWEKPQTLLWPPKPVVHRVVLREKETGQTIIMFPHDTTSLTFDPSKCTRVHTWSIECQPDPSTLTQEAPDGPWSPIELSGIVAKD